MGLKIACIPADNNGNKLWLKDLRRDGEKIFVKYNSTYNDIPFIETEIHSIDNGKTFTINGDDGTVLYRFSSNWIIDL
jgi:hypothetical protein